MSKNKLIISESEKRRIKNSHSLIEQNNDIMDFITKLFMGDKNLFSTILSNLMKDGEKIDANEFTDDLVRDVKTSDDDFYKSVLKCLGAQPTKGNMSFMYAWRQSEGGQADNNPFNTTMKMRGATNYNSVGVKNYPSFEIGVKATCKTLKLSHYTDIVNGLRDDVGLYELSRMESLKKWGTGDLVAKVADGYIKGHQPKPKPIDGGIFS